MASQLWERLRAVRKCKDLRQDDIALVCGVSRSAVAQWEAKEDEKRTRPSVEQIQAIAKLTKIPTSYILNDAANTEDVWKISQMNHHHRDPDSILAPSPAMPATELQHTAIQKAFVSSIEWEVMSRYPELAIGFHQIIGNGLKLEPDFYLNGVLVELKAKPKSVTEVCASLLLYEKAVARPCRKVAIVFGLTSEAGLMSYQDLFGIEIVPVSSNKEAADVLRKIVS